jgi:hypothetical protein
MQLRAPCIPPHHPAAVRPRKTWSRYTRYGFKESLVHECLVPAATVGLLNMTGCASAITSFQLLLASDGRVSCPVLKDSCSQIPILSHSGSRNSVKQVHVPDVPQMYLFSAGFKDYVFSYHHVSTKVATLMQRSSDSLRIRPSSRINLPHYSTSPRKMSPPDDCRRIRLIVFLTLFPIHYFNYNTVQTHGFEVMTAA